MKKTKLRLKKWVRVTIYAIIGIFLILLFCLGCKRYETTIRECDNATNGNCTIYDVQQYVNR